MKIQRNTSPGRQACGVIALTGLLDVTYQEARELVISFRGTHRVVMGLSSQIVTEVAMSQGCYMNGHWKPGSAWGFGCDLPTDDPWYPTLAKWLRQRSGDASNAVWLIETTSHYLLVKARKIWDVSTPDTGCFLRQFKRRRLRVCEAWSFEERWTT